MNEVLSVYQRRSDDLSTHCLDLGGGVIHMPWAHLTADTRVNPWQERTQLK